MNNNKSSKMGDHAELLISAALLGALIHNPYAVERYEDKKKEEAAHNRDMWDYYATKRYEKRGNK